MASSSSSAFQSKNTTITSSRIFWGKIANHAKINKTGSFGMDSIDCALVFMTVHTHTQTGR